MGENMSFIQYPDYAERHNYFHHSNPSMPDSITFFNKCWVRPQVNKAWKIVKKEIQGDIQRYIYCKDMNVPPYEGTYSQQPAIWLFRYSIIKKAFAKIEKQVIQKTRNKK